MQSKLQLCIRVALKKSEKTCVFNNILAFNTGQNIGV